MPVHVERRGGKFRLIEPNGDIAATPLGHYRDGGGHVSRDKADRQARAINDSLTKAKRTLYARRDLINGEDFVAHFKAQGFTTCLEPHKLHATIIYSKTPFTWGDPSGIKPWRNLLTCKGGIRAIDRLGNEGAVVQRFRSGIMKERCEDLKLMGATSDYPTYKPHITITYNAPADLNIKSVKPFTRPLLFGPEIWEVIDKDFSIAEIAEKSRVKYV